MLQDSMPSERRSADTSRIYDKVSDVVDTVVYGGIAIAVVYLLSKEPQSTAADLGFRFFPPSPTPIATSTPDAHRFDHFSNITSSGVAINGDE